MPRRDGENMSEDAHAANEKVAADQCNVCATSVAVSSILLEDVQRDAIIVREFASAMSDGID